MKHLYSFCLLTCALFLSGCGPAGIPVVPVTGEVHYNGQPVGGALVSLVPLSAGGRGAAATTEPDGSFVVMTQGANANGAMIGGYAVIVSKIVAVDGSGNELPKSSEPVKYDPAQPAAAETMPEMKNLLPAKYADKATSGLTFPVIKGKNKMKLELTDEP